MSKKLISSLAVAALSLTLSTAFAEDIDCSIAANRNHPKCKEMEAAKALAEHNRAVAEDNKEEAKDAAKTAAHEAGKAAEDAKNAAGRVIQKTTDAVKNLGTAAANTVDQKMQESKIEKNTTH